MYGINGATARCEAAFVGGKLNDIPDTSTDKSLRGFCVRESRRQLATILVLPNRGRSDKLLV